MKRPLLGALFALSVLVPVSVSGSAATAADVGVGGVAGVVGNPAPPVPVAAVPGGPLMAPASVAVPRATPNPGAPEPMSRADCAALIAAVRAGTVANPPSTCISVTETLGTQPTVPTGPSASQRSGAVSANTYDPSCRLGGNLTAGQWLATSRRLACDHREYTYDVQSVQTGQRSGGFTTEVVHKMNATTGGPSVVISLEVYLTRADGNGTPTGAVGTFAGCPNPNTATAQCTGLASPLYGLGTNAWAGDGTISIPNMSDGALVDDAHGLWTIAFSNPAWLNAAVTPMYSAGIRCDNQIGNRRPGGCVFEDVRGIMGYSQTEYPEFVQHVYNAQISGLPGRFDQGTNLTKLDFQADRDRNQTKACSGIPTAPAGKSCDEYPFASSHEGAATSPYASASAHLPRSFTGCGMAAAEVGRTGAAGWSRCFINAGENSRAGSDLGNFYSDERMLDNDPFQVGYLP